MGSTNIFLEYVCPSMGVFMATIMFAGTLKAYTRENRAVIFFLVLSTLSLFLSQPRFEISAPHCTAARWAVSIRFLGRS